MKNHCSWKLGILINWKSYHVKCLLLVEIIRKLNIWALMMCNTQCWGSCNHVDMVYAGAPRLGLSRNKIAYNDKESTNKTQNLNRSKESWKETVSSLLGLQMKIFLSQNISWVVLLIQIDNNLAIMQFNCATSIQQKYSHDLRALSTNIHWYMYAPRQRWQNSICLILPMLM